MGKAISLVSLCFQDHFCALLYSDTRLSFPIDRDTSAFLRTYSDTQSCLSRSILVEDCRQGFIFLHFIGQFRSSFNLPSFTIFPVRKVISLVSLCFQRHFFALLYCDTRLSFSIDQDTSAFLRTCSDTQSCLSRSVLVKDRYQGFIFLHFIGQFHSSSHLPSFAIFPVRKDISLVSLCFQDHCCALIYSDTRLSFPIDRHRSASTSTDSDTQSCLSRSVPLKDCRQRKIHNILIIRIQ